MKTDPKVRRDGTCANCGGPRKLPKYLNYATVEEFERDPFCSRTCCQAFHGVVSLTLGKKRAA